MDHTTLKEPPPGQLFSPWAARMGLNKSCRDPVFHTGPLFHSAKAPELDSRYYSDRPDILGTGMFPRLTDIDRLFYGDLKQRLLFLGTKSWQWGPLAKSLKFSKEGGLIPGGHQRESVSRFERNKETWPGWISQMQSAELMILPNEPVWFSFFRKDRWYNWGNGGLLLNYQPYSIDHPLVWSVLGVSMELANRMLSALIQDKHPFIWTLLYGYIGKWRETEIMCRPQLASGRSRSWPNEKVLVSYEYYNQVRRNCDPSIKEYMERMIKHTPDEYVQRLESLLRDQKWGFMKGAAGTTYAVSHENSVIVLAVGPLNALITGDITLAERCVTLVFLAVTILHELSHAIVTQRMRETYGEDYNNSENEPFIDFHGVSEIGFEFEAAILGGVLEEHIANLAYPPLAWYLQSWPPSKVATSRAAFAGIINGHADFRDGRNMQKTLLPVEFASKLLSEDFWRDQAIPRKTDNFFHRTPLFLSNTKYKSWENLASYVSDITINSSLDLDTLSDFEKGMVQDWQENENLENNTSTVYKILRVALRLRIEWSCVSPGTVPAKQRMSKQYKMILNGYHIWQRNRFAHDGSDPDSSPTPSCNPDIKITDDDYLPPQVASRSRLWDPWLQEFLDINQLRHVDYLDLVARVIQAVILADTKLPTPWIVEITRVQDALRQTRTRPELSTVDPQIKATSWEAWDFRVPDYNPDDWCTWSPEALTWRRLERHEIPDVDLPDSDSDASSEAEPGPS
ncbi:hypothetical protein EKO27_g1028 [Xylaria grammica]|uniref:Uncharacterized protein n=1 Tax=Xylaria grammica TaxID=363999 RepID=A0A439DI96_9PEZI|nr:hypothetical protein EKO27_g1028 [Xylaria grammica]